MEKDSPLGPGRQSDEWVVALESLVDERMRNAPCATSALDGRLTFAMDFDRYGNPKRTSVAASTLTDCGAVECLRTALESVMAPPASFGAAARHVETIVLTPGQAPRRARDEERLVPSTPRSRCAGPVPSMDAEKPAPGAVPTEEVARGVREAAPAFRACYERGSAFDAELTGTVTIAFVVGAGGEVLTATVRANTLPNCAVVRCVRDAFSRLHLSREAEHGTFVYSLFLSPLEDAFEEFESRDLRGPVPPLLE